MAKKMAEKPEKTTKSKKKSKLIFVEGEIDYTFLVIVILIVAAGRPNMVDETFVHPNQLVIDVGINVKEDGKLCGDVDFENVKEKASAITPVPGGVGPMTIAMLMQNTLTAAKKQNGLI